MDKIKVDLLIKGVLSATIKLGGGKIYFCPEQEVKKHFDIDNAVIIYGDVNIEKIYVPCYVIVVTNGVSCFEKEEICQ